LETKAADSLQQKVSAVTVDRRLEVFMVMIVSSSRVYCEFCCAHLA
jgi:hypothetical protein